jgi:hypothetical protein
MSERAAQKWQNGSSWADSPKDPVMTFFFPFCCTVTKKPRGKFGIPTGELVKKRPSAPLKEESRKNPGWG